MTDSTGRGSNALSAFIESTEISAWAAASYNVNFRNPQKKLNGDDPAGDVTNRSAGRTNQGTSGGLFYLYFPESNTFQLDQAWIGINKAPTEESRAGYNLDLIAGADLVALAEI